MILLGRLAIFAAASVGALLVLAGVGFVVERSVEIADQYRVERDTCLRGATNGLDIRRCTEDQ